MDVVHDAKRLKELQALPLNRKIQITQARIIEWYQHYNGNVCVSFSGGKDSTVLLHIARQIYPDIPAVFSNTGLEYASIQRFIRSWDNVDIVVPKMRFNEVVSTYGYPLIGKEVAEAIYYARRLRSQNVNVERERERERTTCRKRRELLGQRISFRRALPPTGERSSRDACPANRASGSASSLWGGRRKQCGNEPSSRDTASITDENEARRKTRGEWGDWRRRCL